jgi:hypothetical protein
MQYCPQVRIDTFGGGNSKLISIGDSAFDGSG